ncbi:MAG: L-idonate 5-dehydrogenase [Gammaproteobacteria bacterium]|nr:L-idonate 5-dehydrogenase [Gammaproteobacteria bacterium]
MKALVIHAPKDLRITETDTEMPNSDELLIDIEVGGVCGSDLHYYNHGGFGTVKLKEPMILGHEVSGRVSKLGSDQSEFAVGDLVAVSPSRPCFQCQYCHLGLHNHCENMRFYGSAMPWPHIQGAFRQQLVAKTWQCVKAHELSSAEAAMAEPLAVTLHATKRAGELLGKRVLITGCGPIGILSIISARRAGAVEIVATDIADNALHFASLCGADQTINVANNNAELDSFATGKGYFDMMFECSGSVHALTAGVSALKPQSVLMQLGLGGDMNLPMMQITAKEIDLRGSFRFHSEFQLAVELMSSGLVDVKPLITHSVSLADAEDAFRIANERNAAMKTQIVFTDSV